MGARVARQLVSLGTVEALQVVDEDHSRAEAVAATLAASGPAVVAARDVVPTRGGVLVLTAPGDHRPHAELALERGCHVVSVGDAVAQVRSLLDLDAEADERRLHVVVGAGFSPGLSCVLAARAGAGFDQVDEVHVARVGTGGAACAMQHHRSLRGSAIEWRDGTWRPSRAGSGRQLCWFPDPVRGVDCYRSASPEPLLLVPAFPGVGRVTSRVGANRRDRMTARLPMLRRPHPEGTLGAVRVEVRGRRGPSRDERVLGAIDRPAVAAAAAAALAATWVLEGRLLRTGAAGLASLVEPVPFLAALGERGVKVAAFEGAASSTGV